MTHVEFNVLWTTKKILSIINAFGLEFVTIKSSVQSIFLKKFTDFRKNFYHNFTVLFDKNSLPPPKEWNFVFQMKQLQVASSKKKHHLLHYLWSNYFNWPFAFMMMMMIMIRISIRTPKKKFIFCLLHSAGYNILYGQNYSSAIIIIIIIYIFF